jgi:hypothetical protein
LVRRPDGGARFTTFENGTPTKAALFILNVLRAARGKPASAENAGLF